MTYFNSLKCSLREFDCLLIVLSVTQAQLGKKGGGGIGGVV
jgi:hypothetical protein